MFPFPTTTAKNAGAAFCAAGLESTFFSSALRFLAPSSAFASLSLTSMAPPAPVVLDDQIDLKALLVAEIMDTVVDAAVGGKEHANASFRAHVLACCLSRMLVRKPKVCRPTAPTALACDVIQRNYAILNAVFTPFSM